MREPETELEPVPDYEVLCSMPVRMMPDEAALISFHTCDDEDRGDMRDDHGDVFLATEANASEMALPVSLAQDGDTYSLLAPMARASILSYVSLRKWA